jgi:hypothetical protein
MIKWLKAPKLHPECYRRFPGVHAMAVAARCRAQLHLGVKAQLAGPGHQPEQLTADVIPLAVPAQPGQSVGYSGPGRPATAIRALLHGDSEPFPQGHPAV